MSKKVGVLIFILIMIIEAQVFADEPKKDDKVLNILNFTGCSMVFADTALTFDWVCSGKGYEANPFWALIIKKPLLVATLDLGICVGIIYGTRALAEKNKFLGYALAVGVVVVQGYYLYLHYKTRRGI